LILGPSIASNFAQSVQYWLLTTSCLVLARIYMALIPLQEVLEAYFWSGIVSLVLLIALVSRDFVQAILSLTRFSAFAFEPNVLAFILVGYLCAFAWKFMTGKWHTRILAGIAAFLCLAITFFASSRGSLVALFIGGLFVAGVAFAGASNEAKRRFVRLGLFTLILLIGGFFVARESAWTKSTFAFVDQVLAISSPDRGIDSGFTGRFDKWAEIMHGFSDGTWLTGRGLRSSDSMSLPIDNSYLVILYELGLFPLILITWRFFRISRGFVRSYFLASGSAHRQMYLACTLLMVAFLTNDIFGRFMFALANPYSLLAFLLFAAPTQRLREGLACSLVGPRFSNRALSTARDAF